MLLPGVGGSDPRISADPGKAPWSAVLRLQVAGVSRCTAVMVGPAWAATAAHCLWNKRLGRVVPVGSVHLLFGYDAGGFTRHAVPDGMRFAPGADAAAGGPRGTDLVLLHVSPAVLEFVPPVRGAVPPGTPLQMAGFGQDRAERLVVDPGCRALGMVSDGAGAPLLRHDCSGTRGSSGGPVLVMTGEGWRLAGVQVGAGLGAGGVAVPGSVILGVLPD